MDTMKATKIYTSTVILISMQTNKPLQIIFWITFFTNTAYIMNNTKTYETNFEGSYIKYCIFIPSCTIFAYLMDLTAPLHILVEPL